MYQWCEAFGWWHLHHSYVRVGGIKGWTHGGRGSQFWDFRCRAYRAKSIPSRVLWCVPTLGQPGILYLTTTKMCMVYWLISIGIFLWSEPCFYWIWLFEWPSSQWAQLRGLEQQGLLPLIGANRGWRKRDQGLPGPPPPLRAKLWHIYIYLCVWQVTQGC